jgi:hypothetical protein
VAETRYSSCPPLRNRSPGDWVTEYESPTHAPRFPYRLGIHGTVWRFRLSLVKQLRPKTKRALTWFYYSCEIHPANPYCWYWNGIHPARPQEWRLKGYTLSVHTAGSAKRYIPQIHTAVAWGGKGTSDTSTLLMVLSDTSCTPKLLVVQRDTTSFIFILQVVDREAPWMSLHCCP